MAGDSSDYTSIGFDYETPGYDKEQSIPKVDKMNKKILYPKFIYDDLLGKGAFVDPDCSFYDLLTDVFNSVKNMSPRIGTKMQMFHEVKIKKGEDKGETKVSAFFVEFMDEPNKKLLKERIKKIEKDGVDISKFTNWEIKDKKLIYYLSKKGEPNDISGDTFDCKIKLVYFENLISKGVRESIMNIKNYTLANFEEEEDE